MVFNSKLQIANPGRNLKELVEASKNQEKIVDILCYCLMPNHFHLLITQKAEKGISVFLQKLGVGYTHYFNKKYGRSVVLFQGHSKSVLIENDSQLLHLSRYIHLNPSKLFDLSSDFRLIEEYPWSSCQAYTKNLNSPILSKKDPIIDQFKDSSDYYEFLKSFNEEKDLTAIAELTLE